MVRTVAESVIPENDTERVDALRRYQLLDTLTEKSFHNIARLMADVFEVPIALISLVDEEQVFFKGNVGMQGVKSTDRNISLCSFAILAAEPTVFDKPLTEPCLLNNPLVHGEFGLRFYAAAPIITHDGHAIGSVCIIDKKERSFSETQQQMLVRFSKTVMHQIELRLSAIKEKEAEQLLLEKETELKNFINQAPVAIFSFRGENMTMETANQKALQLISRTETAIGKPLLEVVPELTDTPAYEVFQKVYHTGIPQFGNEVMVPLEKDGRLQERYFNFAYTPLRENGKVVGIMDIATEVTEQVIARQKIEESETRFRSIVEEASVATALYTGKDIRITYVNDIMLGYWGKDRSVIGKTFRNALPELESQPFPDLLDQVFVTGVAYQSPDAEAYLMVDGKLKQGFYNFTYKPLFDSQGDVWGIHHMAMDVTEQILAQRKLAESEVQLQEKVAERTKELSESNERLQTVNSELKRSNENLEEFAHAASHDLKEPIRKIHFFTNLLKGQLDSHLSEAERNSFARIEKSTQRMGDLIDDLLLYSHVSHRPHQKEEVNLNVQIEKVLEDLELDIAEKSAIVHVGKLPVVMGYTRQLQQLFQNLLSNAIKYSMKDLDPFIAISAKAEEIDGKSFQAICMQDNGIGFQQDYADKIFQMFTRLHGKDEYRGTGVGLSIAKKIAENHNGFIEATSTLGKGANFCVYLPV